VCDCGPGPGRKPGWAALRAGVREDLETVLQRDPSMHSLAEALLHPSLRAVWAHRLAHRLYRRGRRILPRLISDAARLVSHIEIHPGACVGRRLFVDHGAGVVIGETASIGDDVTLYQQVTLGAVGWWRDNLREPGTRRHPRLGDRVVVGAKATLLGPLVIGDDVRIGAQALVLHDVPSGQRVVVTPSRPETAAHPRPTDAVHEVT
jgi:serine O-acetyltransferase